MGDPKCAQLKGQRVFSSQYFIWPTSGQSLKTLALAIQRIQYDWSREPIKLKCHMTLSLGWSGVTQGRKKCHHSITINQVSQLWHWHITDSTAVTDAFTENTGKPCGSFAREPSVTNRELQTRHFATGLLGPNYVWWIQFRSAKLSCPMDRTVPVYGPSVSP